MRIVSLIVMMFPLVLLASCGETAKVPDLISVSAIEPDNNAMLAAYGVRMWEYEYRMSRAHDFQISAELWGRDSATPVVLLASSNNKGMMNGKLKVAFLDASKSGGEKGKMDLVLNAGAGDVHAIIDDPFGDDISTCYKGGRVEMKSGEEAVLVIGAKGKGQLDINKAEEIKKTHDKTLIIRMKVKS